MKWTPEQKAAIYTTGSDILVSAAAGSGKTAVLVERIIRRLLDKENPINIDEILVVTFTNAAAAEMKSRIGVALEKALIDYPESTHLKKQLSLLPRAQISTLHSFYTRIVRQYAYLFDLDPAFIIADGTEIDLIKQDVIDELFEMYYSKEGEELERFFSVVDRYSSDRSDEAVERLILDLYDFAMQHPFPEQWLTDLVDVYDVEVKENESSLTWLTILKEEVSDVLDECEHYVERALMIAKESDGPYHYAEALEHDLSLIHEAKNYIDDWEALQSFFLNSKRLTLSRKRIECDLDKREQVKSLRDRYVKEWRKIENEFFKRHLSAHLEDMKELHPVIDVIVELVEQFKRLFTEAKRKRALVDFSDLEHLCLAVFTDESSNENELIPSTIALNYKKQFKEILIDEYQDINNVQEAILTLISDHEGRGNRFMVGDVKQSIYRFRHAEPALFIDKYNRFSSDEQSEGIRIDLAKNFRSRENVLTGANYLFRQIFDLKLGEIDYDEKAELVYGNKGYDEHPLEDSEVELLLVDCDDSSSEEREHINEYDENIEKAQLEARLYIKKIKEWMEMPLQVIDKTTNKQRDIQFRDIAILLRSSSWAETIVEEFKLANIPIYAKLKDGYFEAVEIKVMISLLKIIDNPYQDIPLASVLRSPIINLNEEQLMNIRLTNKRKPLFDAVKQFERNNNDELANVLSHFLSMLHSFRTLAREGSLSDLIWHIYQETGYYDFVGGMPGGRQRQANLRALYDRARSYESTSFRGLFRFLRFIERMEEEDQDLGAARALSEEEDVVKLLTMHESKGLEFPVVIIGNMNREFFSKDLYGTYLLDKDYGFATKYINPIKHINYPTLYYRSLQKEIDRKKKAEEMRVLYVALTRAKEKLVMVGTVNSVEKLREKWEEVLDHDEWVLPNQLRKNAKTFLDWVGPALIRHETNEQLITEGVTVSHLPDMIRKDVSKWNITIVHHRELTIEDEREQLNRKELYATVTNWDKVPIDDRDLQAEVNARLNFVYPFKEAVNTRAKQSVTEVKNAREIKDEYSSDMLVRQYKQSVSKRPLFMQTEKQLSAAEIGTAMHTVMQHLPLTEKLNREEIVDYIESFVSRHILREEEVAVIDVKSIEQFFQTELANRIRKSVQIEKEVPFTFTLNASDIYHHWTSDIEEKVLIQGVIDLLIKDESGWTIIDYKTDYIHEDVVTDDVIAQLKERYLTQVQLYKEAIETIIKEPVQHVYLHFFDKQLTIEL